MRLLKASTIELHEFIGEGVPEYAILSHRWGEEEVSMQELTTMGAGSTHTSRGYNKIKRACALAEYHDLEYIWIDTCCIDKTSSAELSEAINSMYRWYAESILCFAHLADVELQPLADATSKRFEKSGWFRRGWTLQELLAPKTLLFFDANWQEIGTRSALASYITKATKIGSQYLRQGRDVQEASIAQRMSWASDRETTRVEDIAYCLMGLFDVNMPLLYGEGRKAFLRLQRELISNYSDESIYAWEPSGRGERSGKLSGILASQPRCFAGSGRIVPIKLPGMRQTPFSITNRGIAMTLPSILRKVRAKDRYEIPIACASEERIQAPLMLCLKEHKDRPYARKHASEKRIQGPLMLRSNEETDRLYAREHGSNGFRFFTKYKVEGAEMKTFHVLLSSGHEYSRVAPISWLSSDTNRVILRMRPVAQAVLRFLGTEGKVHTISEEPTLERYAFEARGIVLEFQYKECRSIVLIWNSCKVALHIEEMCPLKGLVGYELNKIQALCGSMSGPSNLRKDSSEEDQSSSNEEALSADVGSSRWGKCTYTDWGGCQSRPLDDGNFLWLSTRKLEKGRKHSELEEDPKYYWPTSWDYILDLDVSTLDRRSVF